MQQSGSRFADRNPKEIISLDCINPDALTFAGLLLLFVWIGWFSRSNGKLAAVCLIGVRNKKSALPNTIG